MHAKTHSSSDDTRQPNFPVTADEFATMALAMVRFNRIFPDCSAQKGAFVTEIRNAGFKMAAANLADAVKAFSILTEQSKNDDSRPFFADEHSMYRAFAEGSCFDAPMKEGWIFPALKLLEHNVLHALAESTESSNTLEKLDKCYLQALEIWPAAIMGRATKFCARARASEHLAATRTGAEWLIKGTGAHQERILLGDSWDHRFGPREVANLLLDALPTFSAPLTRERDALLQAWLATVGTMQTKNSLAAKEYVQGLAQNLQSGTSPADDTLRSAIESARAIVEPPRKTWRAVRAVARLLFVGT